jgi:hypothetical protein
MNNEISDEAKRALADLPRRRALDRLDRDGAHSTAAVQRRVRALAHERNIPPADFAKLMYKRINMRDVMAFCEKHKVSYDWLLCGDLKGLHRMTGKPCAGVSTVERIVERIMEKYGRLSPDQQTIVTEEVDRMLAEQAVEGLEGA